MGGPAIQVLESNNCLGEELTNKIIQIISTYNHQDLKNRIHECKSEQEAYKVLIPDEPHQVVLDVLKNSDLANRIASFVVPLSSLDPVPIDRNGCLRVNLQVALEIQLKEKKSLSFKEAQNCKMRLGVGSLAEVVRCCPALTHIDMSDGGSDFGLVSAIAEYCPDLESINLTDCAFSSNEISALVTSCPKLTSVTLSGIGPQLVSMFSTIANIPTLKRIDLSQSSCRDAHLKNLFEKGSQLESITLFYCPFISDASLVTIAKSCPLLSRIELTHCPNITRTGLAALKETNPNLTSIFEL
jgi:hypothetical protein